MLVLVSMTQCAGTPTRMRRETLTAADQQLLSQTEVIGLVVKSSSWYGEPFDISSLVSKKLTDEDFIVVDLEDPKYSDCDVILHVKYREKKGVVFKSILQTPGEKKQSSTNLELQMTLKHKRFGELFRREIRIKPPGYVEYLGGLYKYVIDKLRKHSDIKFLGPLVLRTLGASPARIEITGVLPWPEGYDYPLVLITNLTERSVNLKGWYLESQLLQRHRLRNYIKPGETFRIELDKHRFGFSKVLGCVNLVDPHRAHKDSFCWDSAKKGEILRP